MLGHGGSSAGSYLADPTSPIPSHCAVIIRFQSVAVHHLSTTQAHVLSDDIGVKSVARLDTHRIQKLIYMHLVEKCFVKISLNHQKRSHRVILWECS